MISDVFVCFFEFMYVYNPRSDNFLVLTTRLSLHEFTTEIKPSRCFTLVLGDPKWRYTSQQCFSLVLISFRIILPTTICLRGTHNTMT